MGLKEITGDDKRRILELAGFDPDEPGVTIQMGSPIPLGKRGATAEVEREDREPADIHARKLIDHLADYKARSAHTFKAGDLVQAAPASPYRFWTPERPGIVVEVLAEPAFDNKAENNEPDFRLALDLRVATIRGGRFLIFHVHSGYFEPYRGPVA